MKGMAKEEGSFYRSSSVESRKLKVKVTETGEERKCPKVCVHPPGSMEQFCVIYLFLLSTWAQFQDSNIWIFFFFKKLSVYLLFLLLAKKQCIGSRNHLTK